MAAQMEEMARTIRDLSEIVLADVQDIHDEAGSYIPLFEAALPTINDLVEQAESRVKLPQSNDELAFSASVLDQAKRFRGEVEAALAGSRGLVAKAEMYRLKTEAWVEQQLSPA